MRTRWMLLPALLAASALALAGCAGTGSGDGDGDDGELRVVASTDVWGSIAKVVGGDHVQVTSIIDDPDKDPHEYQADARTQLAVQKADLIIANGGGYDDFVGTMVSASGNTEADRIDAVKVSGKTAESGGELNEHVWYDLPTAAKVADRIAADLADLDAAHAADFRRNAKAFALKVGDLEAAEAEVKAGHAGAGVAITEPVPLYLTSAMGLVNRTPARFSEAVEADTDVSPTVLKDTLAIFRDHDVALLAYNEQTTGAQTEAVLGAAKDAGIPVVPVTETLPAGKTYLTWMSSTIDAIHAALGKSR